VSPDDLRTVHASWTELLRQRDELLVSLAEHLRDLLPTTTPASATQRACWLFRAVEDLVGLLPEPSRLEVHARQLGVSWPDKLVAPSYAIDGRAWMRAAAECLPTWSARVEAAWRQAWLLLSDVLAAETLSPFSE
jgi:hypothetical protein